MKRDECGYKSDYLKHVKNITLVSNQQQQEELPLIVALVEPAAGSFQHFMDSGLPKLVQALFALEQVPSDSFKNVILDAPFPIVGNSHMAQLVRKLLQKSANRRFTKDQNQLSTYYKTSPVALVCHAPPVHPVLWQRARQLWGVKSRNSNDNTTGTILYFTRNSGPGVKHGRNVLNEDAVIQFLRERYSSSKVVVINPNEAESVDELIVMMQDTQLIVGVHGGALYNVMLAPSSTKVVEMMPVHPDTGKHQGPAAHIFWLISTQLGQRYGRLHVPSTNVAKGSINVNTTELETLLDLLDQ